MKELFVDPQSIVRKIWGSGDTILLIFAGASAEFALNKAVDWLYFTGRLPADPIGRLFSTVRYAQEIVFAKYEDALAAIDRISAIHKGVEANRGAQIPDAAYLDVLFILIDYSIRSFELMNRRLTETEKAEVFEVFYRVGSSMGLKELPDSYDDWKLMRKEYLECNLVRSSFTMDLYRQYLKSLGSFRYAILIQAQALLVPVRVRKLIALPSYAFFWYPVVLMYKAARFLHIDRLFKAMLLPTKYKAQIVGLDMLSH